MPQKNEVAFEAVADVWLALHQGEGLVAVAQSQMALGDDGALHDDQRGPAQAQEAAMVKEGGDQLRVKSEG